MAAIVGVVVVSASLILSALPPTSGFVGKWLLFAGAFKGFYGNPVGLIIVILAILSTLLTLVYTFLTGIRVFFGKKKPQGRDHPITDPPLMMSLPLLGLVAVVFALGIYPKPLLVLLNSVIGSF